MRLSRWYHFWGRLSNLSMLFENSSLLAINWMKHSMQSIDSEVWVVWPGEKGIAPGFRGFCGVGISFWVFLLENHAVSFDDSSSFTLCGLTSRSWLLMNSWTQYMGSSIGKCNKYSSCSNLSSSSMAFARAAVMTASHSARRNSKCASSLRFFLSSGNSFSWRFFSSYSMAKADFIWKSLIFFCISALFKAAAASARAWARIALDESNDLETWPGATWSKFL